ncbi:hypothetical protein ACIBCT_35430 [Streptosporangium sp. NPDC050855]|uniref:hypothetical protein n=1 Tax=Streptosporangium sp. NPDC050855 TaxID=3366194 RepID=UPI003796FC7E
MHVIITNWDDFPLDAPFDKVLRGDFSTYACFCRTELKSSIEAVIHAAENDLCTACLGRGSVRLVPSREHFCGKCNATGTRDAELANELGQGEVERTFDEELLRKIIADNGGQVPSRTEIFNQVRPLLPEAEPVHIAMRIGGLLRKIAEDRG